MSECLVQATESVQSVDSVQPADSVRGCLSSAELDVLLVRLGAESLEGSQAGRIDRISGLERLKAAAAAAQARETAALKADRVAADRAAGRAVCRLGRGVGAEVALARRESPHKGSRLVGLADALVFEMPATMGALSRGDLSEWRATLMVRETACLSREHRGIVDSAMSGRLGELSDGQLVAEARRLAYQLDPVGFTRRSEREPDDRHVSSRPVPQTMCRVSALLPCAQGVAVIAALRREADRLRAGGDPRSRGQAMADVLVERVTGQAQADQTPVEVQVTVTDQTLFGGGDEPAWLHGHGPLPAPLARTLLAGLGEATSVWLRRFFTDPDTGRLAGVDPKRRLFGGALRRGLIYRDVVCRTPWCGAPIRHLDHVVPYVDGGPTTEQNGQGLCAACNHTKQHPGWVNTTTPDGAGEATYLTTPTGHTYPSRPPRPPGTDPPTNPSTGPEPTHPPPIEIYLRNPYHVEYAA